MKVRLPKSFTNLPQSEKEIIENLKNQEVLRLVNENFAKLQKNWLQLSCIVMADFMGMTAEDCLLYLANFKEVYRRNSNFKTEEEQLQWISGRITEIFGENGYPTNYIDKLEDL